MNEIILETFDHNVVAFNGQTLFFASGEDTTLFILLFLVAGFFLFFLFGNFLQSLFQKKNIFSGKLQQYAPFILIAVFLIGSFVFMQKKFLAPRVNVPVEQRHNLVTIELPTKKVTVKEDNIVTDQYVFSKDDSFYLMILDGNKSTSYSLLLLHNGKQKEVLYSDHFNEITTVQKFLIEHGFPVRYSP
jgi:hypothetical protein